MIYADLNNFKVYNDTYGFENGDKVLKFTAKLIESQVMKYYPKNSFVGHIGGDDFVCIVESDINGCIKLCHSIILKFDQGILDFLHEKDKKNGYMESVDRKGNRDVFPLTSIALGCIYGNFKKFRQIDEISIYMSQVKKKAKKNKNSSYVISNIGA